MQQAEITEFLVYMDQIISATKEGKMVWSPVNETTYSYAVAPAPNARILIQRIPQGSGPSTFILQAIDGLNRSQFSVHSNESSMISTKLRELFANIEKIRDIKSLSFFKTLIPK